MKPHRANIQPLTKTGLSGRERPTQSNDLQIDLVAEQLIFWTIALHPLWWIIGIQVIVYPLIGWYIFYRSFRRPNTVTLLFGWHMWLLYTGVWLLSLMVNWARETAEIGRGVTALGSIFGVWILIAIVWYAVRRLRIRYQVVVRALCIVGLCQLLAVIFGELYITVTGSILRNHSLIITLVPSVPAPMFFDASLYGLDNIGWDVEPVPRLKSFYYWSPLAGKMSIFICMAAISERNRFWQVTAFIGGILTMWFAASRSPQVACVIALVLVVWFGSRLGRKLILSSLLPISILSPIIITVLYKYFFEYRSDSASGRLALYNETYQAFLSHPFLGFGAQGRAQSINLPLGSHSQIYSTLYQTGVIGSCILIIAWIAIAIALLKLVRKHPQLSPTLGAWIGLTLVMPAEELSAASITVFSLGALLGCAWNWGDRRMIEKTKLPCLKIPRRLHEPPLPWEKLKQSWESFQRKII